MTKKKKIIIFALALIIIIAVAMAIWLWWKPVPPKETLPDQYDPNLPYGSVMEPQKISEPEFMSDKEREDRGLSEYQKVQVLKRDDSGKAIAYKIIKNDSDIISDFYSPKQVVEIQKAIASSSPETVSAIIELASTTPNEIQQ